MKMKSFLLATFLIGLWLPAQAERIDRVSEAIARDPGRTFQIYLFEIKENIAPPAVFRTNEAFIEADSLRVDLILIHMNTYGGMVESADSIRTRILESNIPVMVFIDNNAASAGALISIAADRIYMRPGGNFGAATPVDQTGEVAPEKIQSYMRSMMRSTAEVKGRDPDIAEAMVYARTAIPGLIEEGQVLTFTAAEAIEWGYSEGSADNITEMLELAGIENYEIIEQRLTLIDRVIAFLINPVIAGLLIMLILGGIYFELQTPGVGFPILVAIAAAVVYFAPLYIEGLAANWEIILFILGVVLLGVEIFVTPGFGVAGVTGAVFIATGLVMAMLGNEGFDFSGVPFNEILIALSVVVISFFLSLILSFYIGKKLFTQTTHFKGLALAAVQETESGFTSANIQIKNIVGKTGMAFTILRPSGKVEIEGDIYDATAVTGFIDKGQQVRVVKYETSQVFVVKA
ncbi:MAG TPA: NfeD family protein [Bacteroidales bacterium]|nr:NfeD family protein [Bacteroidales bacterium]